MGFPVCYSELLLPKLLIHTLTIFSLLRWLLSSILRLAGLPEFLDPPESFEFQESSLFGHLPVPNALMHEILPVVKFSDLDDPPESCAVCLYEFEPEDETRRLANCCHVFHRSCLDRWMGYDQRTCPLCRTALLPDDVSLNHSLWAAAGVPEFSFFDGELDSHLLIANGDL